MKSLAIYETQSNTKAGSFRVLAGADLTGKEGTLVKLTHSGGIAEVVPPADVADEADYLLLEGGADAELVTVLPLDRDQQVRVRLDGTCNPGDKLTLATIATNPGEVRTLPAAADTYWLGLRAEEAGVDGQLVKCRLLPNPGPVTVV